MSTSKLEPTDLAMRMLLQMAENTLKAQAEAADQLAIEHVKHRMTTMTDEQRLALIADLMYGYCKWCGCANLPCYCTRDE